MWRSGLVASTQISMKTWQPVLEHSKFTEYASQSTTWAGCWTQTWCNTRACRWAGQWSCCRPQIGFRAWAGCWTRTWFYTRSLTGGFTRCVAWGLAWGLAGCLTWCFTWGLTWRRTGRLTWRRTGRSTGRSTALGLALGVALGEELGDDVGPKCWSPTRRCTW